MLTLALALLFNTIIWSAVFFFLRKIQSTHTNGSRHLRTTKSYGGNRTASAHTLFRIFCFFIVLVFIVFFSAPQIASFEAGMSAAGFVLISFLAYLYLLRLLSDGKKHGSK